MKSCRHLNRRSAVFLPPDNVAENILALFTTLILIVILTLCTNTKPDINKEILSNATATANTNVTSTPKAIYKPDFCSSDELEDKDISDERLKELVICLFKYNEQSKIEQAILSHNKQDIKVFKLLRSSALVLGDTSIPSEDISKIYDEIKELPEKELESYAKVIVTAKLLDKSIAR